jgi:hypothetical protein
VKSSRERAAAHAKHPHYCSCGKVVWGNGAKAQHRLAHARRADGHRYVMREAWLALLAAKGGERG